MDFHLTEEHRMWQQAVHQFCADRLRPTAAEFDARAEMNVEAVRAMTPLGLLGMAIPESLGGAGVDAVSSALAIEELGWGCGGTALTVAAHNALGCAPIALFGTPAQKGHWLPGLARGEPGLGALALTEPGAGSDLAGIQTSARQEAGEWVIHGSKAWITNAAAASVIITLCRTHADAGSRSFSLILVPRASPGLHVHPAEKKMGVRASPTHALTYEDVRVPMDQVLGEPGAGLSQTLQVLDGGRVGIAALSVGIARAALEEAVRYARERTAFGKTLAQHEAIQWMLADAATQIEAARLLTWQAAWLKGQQLPYSKQAAMAKLLASETSEAVARNAIQILGSYGYSQEYPVERMYRDARLMTIGEGTSEVQRMVIARRVIEGG
ncbi:MAG: acyl-CoA dehydrogenase family protein [Anaerolineales bacterium]|nr:acyl-CoA dehydrogenase family protein [Anaerolineales bacterium]